MSAHETQIAYGGNEYGRRDERLLVDGGGGEYRAGDDGAISLPSSRRCWGANGGDCRGTMDAQGGAAMKGKETIATARRERMGFLTAADVEAIAADPETRVIGGRTDRTGRVE